MGACIFYSLPFYVIINMDKHYLPKSVEINGVECTFKSDYRDILYLFEILSDPDLLQQEAVMLACENFYDTDYYMSDLNTAITEMFSFMSCGDNGSKGSTHPGERLYDWDKDFNIIIAPINRILGYDVRGVEYLHWWTFMSAFMEIGECTFSTYVSIRRKLQRGIKLEKHEEKIYREHAQEISLPKKYDSTTQALMDEILG